MTHTKSYDERTGWILEVNKPMDVCFRCKRKLILPFFFCPTSELGYCQDCEREDPRPTCKHILTEKKPEHIHYLIKSCTIRKEMENEN